MFRSISSSVLACALIILFTLNVFAYDKPLVFVSIVPQKYFVQQIVQDLVDVRVMVQPGASPATYEPKPGQMVDLSKSKAYFAIGVPFENAWLKKIAAANPKMKVVHTDQGIRKIPMAARLIPGKAAEHSGEGQRREEDHHGHSGLDPHIWLSPTLVKTQTRIILTVLQEIDPSHRSIYESNYNQFVASIDALDAQLKTIFAHSAGQRFMVFHPAWGYFADAYGLEQIPIEIDGKNPKPAQLKATIELAREKGIQIIFVQPQFSKKSAELIAREIGGQVAVADPLAEDWPANLRDMAGKFKAALRE